VLLRETARFQERDDLFPLLNAITAEQRRAEQTIGRKQWQCFERCLRFAIGIDSKDRTYLGYKTRIQATADLLQGNPRLTVSGPFLRQPASNSSTRTVVGRAFACGKSECAVLRIGELARGIRSVRNDCGGSFSPCAALLAQNGHPPRFCSLRGIQYPQLRKLCPPQNSDVLRLGSPLPTGSGVAACSWRFPSP
jgi:hypothetical protein